MQTFPLVSLAVKTHSRSEMIDVTDRVRQAVSQAGIADGMVLVYVPHTTAAATINENADPDVRHDMLRKLDSLVPKDESYYRHGEWCFCITNTSSLAPRSLLA
ncbi:MAG TPA: secondary thiamine-phosphate synthase enzyme YjbQ [Tepidisphaeraceae bacterium]|jgi:secondary thiamine-phosphate synthase enzyme|nr:secondary thiamine-phosphate synthase enzyme YjbQ [Tepidisphaeraceae bacterium]